MLVSCIFGSSPVLQMDSKAWFLRRDLAVTYFCRNLSLRNGKSGLNEECSDKVSRAISELDAVQKRVGKSLMKET